MGLDSVEFVLSLEEAFELEIPDAAASLLATPRHVIGYLATRLPVGRSAGACLSQRAFYRVRRAICTELGVPSRAVRPGTRLEELIPPAERDSRWQAVGRATGARDWPRIGCRRFFERFRSPHVERAGQAACFLAARQPWVVKGRDAEWTRAEIAQVVDLLIRAELGVEEYTLDSHFVRDLGVN